MQNCLFVHDILKKSSPSCFYNYFTHSRDIHPLRTLFLLVLTIILDMAFILLKIPAFTIGILYPPRLMRTVFRSRETSLKIASNPTSLVCTDILFFFFVYLHQHSLSHIIYRFSTAIILSPHPHTFCPAPPS